MHQINQNQNFNNKILLMKTISLIIIKKQMSLIKMILYNKLLILYKNINNLINKIYSKNHNLKIFQKIILMIIFVN